MTNPTDELTAARELYTEIRDKLADWTRRAEAGEDSAESKRRYYEALIPGWERHVKVLEERSESVKNG